MPVLLNYGGTSKAVKLINVLFEDFHNHEIGDDDVDWYRSYFDVILIQYAENEDGEELKDSRLLEFRVDGVSITVWFDLDELNFDCTTDDYLNAGQGDDLSEFNLSKWVGLVESFIVQTRGRDWLDQIYEYSVPAYVETRV